MTDRIRYKEYEDKIMSAEEAALLIEDGMTIAVSGFTPSGCPKEVPLALSRQVEEGRQVKVNLLSGASTGGEIDAALGKAGIIAKRAPYITSDEYRKVVNSGESLYFDAHLGSFAQNARYGFYGDIDVALIEACAITEDGGIVPTTAVGAAAAFCKLAKKIVVELNLNQPAALEGIHDIYTLSDPPHRQPIPITGAGDRVGKPYIQCDPDRVAAIIITEAPERPRPLADPDENSQAIADNIVELLKDEEAHGRISPATVPLQSGVGSVANAVLFGLKNSSFNHLTFYSEVMQDGILELFDCGKADFCSATSLSLSREGMEKLLGDLDRYKDKIVLRDSELSNNPEVIRRLGVIAMNTAIEADIFGNVNSSHMLGTKIYNGIGGSCDYARNASLTIFMTNSTAKDGKISSIVPMVSHCDHTEHDVDIIVTEQGIADLRGKAPKERVNLIIENCAHPDYRPLLRAYYEEALKEVGPVQTPHILGKAFSFHQRFMETGSMK